MPDPVPRREVLPSGTVTFAFTDVERSTQRWERDRTAMQDAVRRHKRACAIWASVSSKTWRAPF